MYNKKNKGYSILEGIIAMGILLVAIVPVVTIAARAITFSYKASEGEGAVRVSETMVEYIKSRGYDNISARSGKIYKIVKTDVGESFTAEGFGNDFGIDDNLVLLNSKGIGLKSISIYIVIEKDNDIVTLKKSDGSNEDQYENIITGVKTTRAYGEGIIYGKVIVGYGDEDAKRLSGRSKEIENEFVVTPIENWK